MKAALEAGLFDELGYTMRKYADEPVVPFKAILALSALSSGANSKMQKGATHVFHAFMPAMRRLHDKGIEAVQALTKNKPFLIFIGVYMVSQKPKPKPLNS